MPIKQRPFKIGAYARILAIGSTILSALITKIVPVVIVSTRTWLLEMIRVLLCISQIGINE